MALITCPECGKQISDRAKSCPDCGFPINTDETAGEGVSPANSAGTSAINMQSVNNVGTNEYQTMTEAQRKAVESYNSKKKKKWSVPKIILAVVLALAIGRTVAYKYIDYSYNQRKGYRTNKTSTTKNTDTTNQSKTEEKQIEADPALSHEYRNALESARVYSEMMNMSKKGIYDQLISEYGDKFPKDAAQYAIDNLDADWKKNALESAKTYSDEMHMSRQDIYDQLISEYGDQFTAEEAQYAIDHLYD